MTTEYVHPDPACKPSRHRPNIPGASFIELDRCELSLLHPITSESDLTEDTVQVCDRDHPCPPSTWLAP